MSKVDELRFDPGPDCLSGCERTDDRYCDLTCVWEPDPLTWDGDDS